MIATTEKVNYIVVELSEKDILELRKGRNVINYCRTGLQCKISTLVKIYFQSPDLIEE